MCGSGKERQQTCRYCARFAGANGENLCYADTKEGTAITQETCASCEKYHSRYIEFPITVTGIENQEVSFSAENICTWVQIRPCSSEYPDKTFLGIYLGELPVVIGTTYDEKTGKMVNQAVNEAAILVPDLKKILYGNSNCWQFLQSPEDLRELTDQVIDQMWYAQLARTMGEAIALQDRRENREKTTH